MLRNHLLLLFFVYYPAFAYSLEWNRGLVQIDQIDPGIHFSTYGDLNDNILLENLPRKLSRLSKFHTDHKEKLLFRISTGVLGKWEGPGKLSIEAFDHSWLQASSSNGSVNELTRTILYFNSGFLFINAKKLEKESSIRIETPLGVIISYGGIFSIMLEELKGSGERNALIASYEGSLVYTDQRGNAHSLRDGNKMSIMLKDDLFKVNVVELDSLEERAVGNFNKERVNFIEANAYPEVERPIKLGSVRADSTSHENESVQEYYYFPVIKRIKSFNPYKKSYSDD